MLIEFSVSNYRSIQTRQTFSMVAVPRLGKKQNVIKPDLIGERFPSLLKVAAIYGPNASGKSNFLEAMSVVRRMLTHQPTPAPRKLPVASFRFDKASHSLPSEFELHFIAAQQRYEYFVAATEDRITAESLITYPKGKETLLFRRTHTPEGDQYEFGNTLEGGKDIHHTWQKLTSPQSLFLAQAVANSNETMNQLRVPFIWLSKGQMEVGAEGLRALTDSSLSILLSQPKAATNLATFLTDVDIPVTDIQVERQPGQPTEYIVADAATNADGSVAASDFQLIKNLKATLTHKTALGEAKFDFSEESTGTKNLIGFWLPWFAFHTATIFKTLIIDELDSSLHPNIVALLVSKIIESNNPTQLIFSTHDTHLMNTKLLRRDQIWITERDTNGATELRAIYDFQGRESEDIEKRYHEGRYRGLPSLRGR